MAYFIGSYFEEATLLKSESNVRILGIGVGEQALNRASIRELREIVSDPIDGQSKEFWQAESFYDLADLAGEIANEVCREARNAGSGGPSDDVGMS